MALRKGAVARTACLGVGVLALGSFGVPVARAEDGFVLEGAGQVTALAADRASGTYWVPEPTRGTVRAFGADGSPRGTLRYGASPVDVQAASMRGGRLWIGDIGDPTGTRQDVVAHRIANPQAGQQATHRSYSLRYPDGAHDAAAMAVSPRGRLYLVTRGEQPGIYRSGAELVPGGTPNMLVRVAEAPPDVSDATFSADGSRLVLRTGTALRVLDPYSFAETATANLPAPVYGGALAPALEQPGRLAVTGTGDGARLAVQPLPQRIVPLATAAASPTPAPAVRAQDEGTGAARQNGTTLWALALAGLISLAAGAVVVLKR